MDRRGRGESTDAANYSLQREGQDIVEVANALPAPVFVVGHSIGAITTLEALRLTNRFQRAVLYEPPLPVLGGMEGSGPPVSVCSAVAAGDNDKAMTVFFSDYVMMSPATVAAFRKDPSWSERIKLAPTVCREATAQFTYKFQPDRFERVTTPTLFLLGGDSPKAMAVSTRAGAAALPHGQVEILPGQQHVANLMAPELLAHDIVDFFGS
jgi:pimeloyl-ACP methyl ester carboxylesterase